MSFFNQSDQLTNPLRQDLDANGNNLINVGASYENAKRKDIETLENLNVTEHSFKSTPDLIEEARVELIKAFLKPDENGFDAFSPRVVFPSPRGARFSPPSSLLRVERIFSTKG